MLFREYNVWDVIGNEEFPFCICNAKLNECRRLDYIDKPTPEELEAPALEIIPLSKDEEYFYSQFSTDYIDKNGNDIPVGDEVMKAMRGQSGEWKVIRCCVVSGGLIFVVVNPAVYASGVEIKVGDALYGTYEADLKEGKVYIWLNRQIIRHAYLKVKVKKYRKGKLKTSRMNIASIFMRAEWSLPSIINTFEELVILIAKKKATMVIESTSEKFTTSSVIAPEAKTAQIIGRFFCYITTANLFLPRFTSAI